MLFTLLHTFEYQHWVRRGSGVGGPVIRYDRREHAVSRQSVSERLALCWICATASFSVFYSFNIICWSWRIIENMYSIRLIWLSENKLHFHLSWIRFVLFSILNSLSFMERAFRVAETVAVGRNFRREENTQTGERTAGWYDHTFTWAYVTYY